MSGEQPVHRTLFAVEVGDRRARRRRGAPVRGRGAGRGATSDVRRHRLLLLAGAAAFAGVGVAWGLAPSDGPTRGALALPHAEASLACSACHREEPLTRPSAEVCKSCHGPHPSLRVGHRALADKGELDCLRCHDVHGADQGVRFVAPSGEALRYGVGVSEPLPGITLPSGRDLTVVLVPVARCVDGCHDLTSSRDPIGRCLAAAQTAPAGTPLATLSLCFDEHQAWSAVAAPRPGGVCASQHQNDRFAAWEAARAAVLSAPTPPTGAPATRGRFWLASGALAGLLGALGFVGVTRLRARRRREEPQTAVAKPCFQAIYF